MEKLFREKFEFFANFFLATISLHFRSSFASREKLENLTKKIIRKFREKKCENFAKKVMRKFHQTFMEEKLFMT